MEHPVFGLLAEDPASAQEPVWLRAPDGAKLSIVWPDGFSAVLTGDELAVADETGAIAIRSGDAVELQVSRTSATGAFDDPYYASGILIAGHFTAEDSGRGVTFQGCYPRKAAAPFASAATLSPETAACLGSIQLFANTGMPAPEASGLVASFETTTGNLELWKAAIDDAFGGSVAYNGPSPSPGGETVYLCYFDGDFGRPRGPEASGVPDWSRAIIEVDQNGRIEPLAGGFRDSLPVIDPNGL